LCRGDGAQGRGHRRRRPPERSREFGGGRTRDEIARAEQIKKLLVAYPVSPPHGLLAHERDMGGETTEGNHTELEKESGDVPEPRRTLARHFIRWAARSIQKDALSIGMRRH